MPLSTDQRAVSLRAFSGSLLVTVLITLSLVAAWRAIEAEQEARENLAAAFALSREMMDLKHQAAEVNGWQTAYALEIWRNSPGALSDDHPARAAFLEAAHAFRSKLAAVDTGRLAVDERRTYASTQRAFDQFMGLQDRIMAAYRRETPQFGALATTLVLGPEIALYEQTKEQVTELAERVVARGEQAAADAARASDRATTWKLSFGIAAIGVALIFSIMNFRTLRQRTRLIGNLDALARTDQLTGIANRRRWDEELPLALERARRTERPLSVAMLDLDHFKAFNDTNGHIAGDRVLATTAKAFAARLREGDMIARYGGEEFAIVLHGCGAEAAREIIDRVREAVHAGLTFSVGITESDGHEEPNQVVARADRALYAAKHAGRNRTVMMRSDATVELQRRSDSPYVLIQGA